MGTARWSQPWRRPVWLEPRLWILLLLVVLLLPWSTAIWIGAAAAPSDAFPPAQLFLEGWSIFLLFGLPYLVPVVAALAAFIAATRGWPRAALVAAFAASLGAVNVVLLFVAERSALSSLETTTPLALSVLVGLPAPALLAWAFVRAAPTPNASRAQDRIGLSLGFLGFVEFFIVLMALSVIFPTPSGGLSDRRYPELTVFLFWIGNWVFLGIALPLLTWATRIRSGSRGGNSADTAMRSSSTRR